MLITILLFLMKRESRWGKASRGAASFVVAEGILCPLHGLSGKALMYVAGGTAAGSSMAGAMQTITHPIAHTYEHLGVPDKPAHVMADVTAIGAASVPLYFMMGYAASKINTLRRKQQ
jgi:hypothetical protein